MITQHGFDPRTEHRLLMTNVDESYALFWCGRYSSWTLIIGSLSSCLMTLDALTRIGGLTDHARSVLYCKGSRYVA